MLTFRHLLAPSVIGLIGISGCGERQWLKPAPSEAGGIRRMVAGAAERSLDEHGLFVVTAPSDGPLPRIDQPQAVLLARAFMRDFGQATRRTFEKAHGGSINVDALKTCDRVFYGASPYAEMADYDVAPVFHRTFGSFWLVSFCEGEKPAVSVAVSVFDNHLAIDDGHLRYPMDQIGGQEFWQTGIPKRRAMPVPPEDAVRLVFHLTGRRVIDSPLLVIPAVNAGMPQSGRWKLRIDRPVSLQIGGGDEVITTDVLYVGNTNARDPATIEVAAGDRPTKEQRMPSVGSVGSWMQQPHRPGDADPSSDLVITQRLTNPTKFVPVSALARR